MVMTIQATISLPTKVVLTTAIVRMRMRKKMMKILRAMMGAALLFPHHLTAAAKRKRGTEIICHSPS